MKPKIRSIAAQQGLQYGPQQLLPLSSDIGDIFWNLPPFITYIAEVPIGVTIYVANPSDIDRDYSLSDRLVGPSGEKVLEETITVYDHAWFTVEAGQFIKLQAELIFDTSNVILTVALIERSTDSEANTVSTYLVSPTAAQIPPGFPAIPTTPTAPTAGFDWSTMISFAMFAMMIGMVGSMFMERKK